MLIYCQSPPPKPAASQPAARSTSYPMPSLNPTALASLGEEPTALGADQVPTGALATAAVDSTSAGGSASNLVTLNAAERQIPAPVLTAYQQAATMLASEQPGCHLRWQLLAGIGKVESGNAQGRHISTDGTITPTILGPRLTGSGGFARILDTDGGQLDHDTLYDRAVGPMQFLPGTWKGAGRDANADGRKDPNNIHDAALTTASYLCAHHRDLTIPAQLNAAIRAYNNSDAYVRAVLAWTTGYATTAPDPIDPPPAAPTTAQAPTPSSSQTHPTDTPSPVLALTPNSTPPPSPATCTSITLTPGSLTAVTTTTSLELTGLYTTTTNTENTITLNATAHIPNGHPLTQTTTKIPERSGQPRTLLATLPLSQLTRPGQTTTVTITLTAAQAGCPTNALATVTIANVTSPATTPASDSNATATPSPERTAPPPTSSLASPGA